MSSATETIDEALNALTRYREYLDFEDLEILQRCLERLREEQ